MLDVAILATTCIANLSLGFLVLVRNPRSKTSIAFFIVSACVSLWAVSNYLTGLSSLSLFANNIFNRLAFFAAFLAIAFGLRFVVNFLGETYLGFGKALDRIFTILGVSVALLSLTPLVAGVVTEPRENELHFSIGVLLLPYVAAIGLFIGLIVRTLVKIIKRTRGREKQQALYMLIGFSVPPFLGLITNAIIPSLTTSWHSASFGPIFTLLLVGTISYAIIKHQLFDIRLVVARSIAYLSSFLVASLLYVAPAALLATYILHVSLELTTILTLTVITLGVAFLFHPLRLYFNKVTNRFFYRDAYEPQAFIDQLNRMLVANIELDVLLSRSAEIINENLKSEYCMLGIRETKFRGQRIAGTVKKAFSQQDLSAIRHSALHLPMNVAVTDFLTSEYDGLKKILMKNDIGVIVRISPPVATQQKQALGYILLGQKKSGNPYNSQDVEMLDIISRELLIAIQNAIHYEEIENFNVTLQEKIEEATRKLRRTNEKLRLLDETKDDFISMASHQLRTPLTSVKGYVSMVLDGDAGKLTGMQRKLLNQSFISAQRMVYLISDLLNVSRLRTGKFVIEPVSSNLATLIKSEVDQLMETAEGRNLTLTFHKPEHFPTLMLDETKMRQVIMNFIDNAIYYTPSGGNITVNLVEKPQTVEFTVVDDGIGVPKHEQHHLFTKFYRAGNAKRARPDGTGLGLFMAKKVIIAQGGATIFRSQEGKGSTFGFSFAKNKLLPSNQSVVTTETVHK